MEEDGGESYGEDEDNEEMLGVNDVTSQLAAAGWQHGVHLFLFFYLIFYYTVRQCCGGVCYCTYKAEPVKKWPGGCRIYCLIFTVSILMSLIPVPNLNRSVKKTLKLPVLMTQCTNLAIKYRYNIWG